MKGTRHLAGILAALGVGLALFTLAPRAGAASDTLPARLSDADFWKLVTDLSEPDGYFQSDNLVSNELTFQHVIPTLQKGWAAGSVYLGVGPDQNFTYIASLKPKMAFIVDIRRGNLLLQLMYKAIIEQSATRAAFLSRLFSRETPAGLPADASATQLLTGFAGATPSRELYVKNLKGITDHLVKTHGFSLSESDLGGIDYVLSSFYAAGPYLAYGNAGRGGRYPTYQDLMVATDQAGESRSYMASEALYGVLRDLQLKNLLVPVVGDFGGPKALREVGRYLKERSAIVGAIYTSNVEQYLFQYGTWQAYYANVAMLPTDDSSTFVRSCFNSCATVAGSRSAQLLDPVGLLLRDVAAGKIVTYYDVLAHSR